MSKETDDRDEIEVLLVQHYAAPAADREYSDVLLAEMESRVGGTVDRRPLIGRWPTALVACSAVVLALAAGVCIGVLMGPSDRGAGAGLAAEKQKPNGDRRDSATDPSARDSEVVTASKPAAKETPIARAASDQDTAKRVTGASPRIGSGWAREATGSGNGPVKPGLYPGFLSADRNAESPLDIAFGVRDDKGIRTVDHTPPEDIEKIRPYLAVKFDEFEVRPDGSRVVHGLAYNEKAHVEPVNIPELVPFLPKTRWFVTELDTAYYEYPKVKLVVCITPKKSGDDIRNCWSPVFSNPSRKFLALFAGLAAKSPDERKQLAIGVGKLLAAVTSRGEVRPSKTDSHAATVELWHGDRHWRNIEVRFDKDGNSENVVVYNPKKSGKRTKRFPQ